MDLGLRGKVAVVSGSSDGIGYAVAHSLAQEGARIVLCARREAFLAEARKNIEKETGAEVLALTCDVQRLDDVQRLVMEVMQRFGVIHILVNNAGSRAEYPVCRHRRCSVVSDVRRKIARLHSNGPGDRASHAQGRVGPDH